MLLWMKPLLLSEVWPYTLPESAIGSGVYMLHTALFLDLSDNLCM